jgi:allantoinase
MQKKIINAEEILFRHKISPYIGEELYGTVTLTIVNGTIVFENNVIVKENIGQIIRIRAGYNL